MCLGAKVSGLSDSRSVHFNTMLNLQGVLAVNDLASLEETTLALVDPAALPCKMKYNMKMITYWLLTPGRWQDIYSGLLASAFLTSLQYDWHVLGKKHDAKHANNTSIQAIYWSYMQNLTVMIIVVAWTDPWHKWAACVELRSDFATCTLWQLYPKGLYIFSVSLFSVKCERACPDTMVMIIISNGCDTVWSKTDSSSNESRRLALQTTYRTWHA